MKEILDSFKRTGNLHHAYCLIGDIPTIKDQVENFLNRDLKFPLQNNPDLWSKEYKVFKIDDSRALAEKHQNKTMSPGRKIFVLTANFMTKDAQNSLLKIFEEPTADTTFFLIMPSDSTLLPTLRSRLMVIKIVSDEIRGNDGTKFLNGSIGDRLKMIKKITDGIADETMDKSSAIDFLKEIESAIGKRKKERKDLDKVEKVEKAISYLNDEAPSVKMILEYVAMAL
ncbi:MAG: hypothetical protein WCO10_02165 [bacterium]